VGCPRGPGPETPRVYGEFTRTSAMRMAALRPLGGQWRPSKTPRVRDMTAFLLWLLVIAVGVYLLVAMLRPDKF
jgi:K+-transporting ATPase KdpF subunit